MNKVGEERMKLRIEYSRETDLIFSDNIPAYADWLENKLALRQPPVGNRSCCSKCGKSLSTRWEESACHIKLEIGIDCCSTEALFGRDEKIGFNHPAIKEGSGYQKVFIESRKESDYRLCWNCHRDFVKLVGTFLKNDR